MASPRSLWKASCTVPAFPSRCPRCKAKVRIFHINMENEAMFVCANLQVSFAESKLHGRVPEVFFLFLQCHWPLDVLSPNQFMGFSDYRLYHKMQKHEKMEKQQLKRRTTSSSSDSSDIWAKTDYSPLVDKMARERSVSQGSQAGREKAERPTTTATISSSSQERQKHQLSISTTRPQLGHCQRVDESCQEIEDLPEDTDETEKNSRRTDNKTEGEPEKVAQLCKTATKPAEETVHHSAKMKEQPECGELEEFFKYNHTFSCSLPMALSPLSVCASVREDEMMSEDQAFSPMRPPTSVKGGDQTHVQGEEPWSPAPTFSSGQDPMSPSLPTDMFF